MRTLTLFLIAVSLTAGAAFAKDKPPALGASLYREHCAACHGPLKRTDIPNRPSGRITSAIRVFPSMNHLKQLSREEIHHLVEALTRS